MAEQETEQNLEPRVDQKRTEQKTVKVAIVGRPNVGKSTLINRITGHRVAITHDVPGTTRDTAVYESDWNGVELELIDTGGYTTARSSRQNASRQSLGSSRKAPKGHNVQNIQLEKIDDLIVHQMERGIKKSDVVLFMVDGKAPWTDEDKKLIKLIKQSGKPIIFVSNKNDTGSTQVDFRALGLGAPFEISALHGKSIGDLLDLLVQYVPQKRDAAAEGEGQAPAIPKIALIGRLNVGKSSLLNKLLHTNRVIVSDMPGTTRDSVAEEVKIGNSVYEVVDTAGIKKKLYKMQGSDFYANIRTKEIVRQVDVCILLIDSTVGIDQQDLRLASLVAEAGRGLVIAMNKWDALDDYQKQQADQDIDLKLTQFRWVPLLKISAVTGRGVGRLEKFINLCMSSLDTRIPTPKVTAFIRALTLNKPHALVGGVSPKIQYATQASAHPVEFVLFSSKALSANYQRFLVNSLREKYGFEGAPIKLIVRVKAR
jgi:GTP-binding protein